MPTPITIDASVNLDFRQATAKAAAFQKQFQSGFDKGGGVRGVTADIASFENALGRATNRIVSLGAASVVFNTLRKSFGQFAEATVDVEQLLARINVNLGQTTENLKQFSGQIFNIARATGTTFEEAAKGAEELARQGLGAEETLKRLKDALVLSRVAGIDSATAVDSLTGAINSFNREALTSTDILNRYAAVDTKFAVSTKDLEEAVSRVGSAASEAGVSFNELLAVVTSVQQTTARGGATIGNALKTIFTRVGRPEVLEQLQSIGVAVRDVEGNTLPAIRVLQNLASVYDDLSASQKNVVSRQVAGTFQINILKAALADLNKEQSTYNGALKTAANAGDAANKKNEQLNKTLKSSIEATKNSITQLFSSLGSQDLGPLTKSILDSVENARKFLSGDAGHGIGEDLGKGILKGIANVISGPGLLAVGLILARGLGKVVKTIASEAQGLLGINDAASKRAEIQGRILSLLKQSTAAELANFSAASSTLRQAEALLAIKARIRQTELIGTPLTNFFSSQGPLGGTRISPLLRGVPSVAKGPTGYIGNFAAGGGGLLGYGAEGSVYASGKRRDYAFKRFHTSGVGGEKVDPSAAIANEFNLTKLAQDAGLPVLPVVGSLKRSVAIGGLVKPAFAKDSFEGSALNDIDPDIGAGLASHFTSLFKTKGIDARDLTGGGNIRVKGDINQYRRLANQIGPDAVLEMLKGNASVYDLGAFSKSADRPNFADPLYEAIRREKAAGIPEHQIYVDRDPRVAGPGNPQGLLVANKRDEPAGGHQGVDRVLAQGGNPKRAGMIGNFARKQPLLTQQEIVNQRFGVSDSRYDDGAAKIEKVAKALDSFEAAVKRSDDAVQKNADALSVAKDAVSKFADLARQGNPFGTIPPTSGRSTTVSQAQIQQALYGPKTFGTEAAPVQGTPEKQFPGDGGYAERFLRNSAGASQYKRPAGPSAAGFNAQQAQQKRDAAFKQNSDSLIDNAVRYDTALPGITGRQDRLKRDAQRKALRDAAIQQQREERQDSIVAQNARLDNLRPQLQGSAARGQASKVAAAQNAIAEKKARRSATLNNASLIASFVLPAAAGFIPEGKGGTGAGIAGGIASGALQGAGTGAILGPVGAGIGAAVGGIVGALSKLTKSVEEYNEEVDNGTSAQVKSIDAISQFVALGNQLKEADAASPEARTRIAGQRAQALTQVDPEFREALSKQGISQEETNKILIEAEKKRESVVNRAELNKSANAINDASNGTAGRIAKLLDKTTLGNPASALFGKDSNLFRSDDLRSPLSEALKAKDGLSKDDQGFLNRARASGGGPGVGDLEHLNKILGDLGVTTKATDDTFEELADGLAKGQNAFRDYNKGFTEQRRQLEEARGRLLPNSFLSRPNLDVYSQSASLNRNPLANRGQRAQAKLNLFDELSNSGAVGFDKTSLEGNKEYKRAKAGVQSTNVSDAAIAFLQGNNPGSGSFRDAQGNPQLTSIQRTLELVSKGGGANADDAKTLLTQVTAAIKTGEDNKIKTTPFTQGVTGIVPGADYGAFTKGLKRGGAGYITKDNLGVLQGTVPTRDFVTAGNIASRKPGEKAFDLRQAPAAAPSTAPTQYDNPDKKRDDDIANALKEVAAKNSAAAAATVQAAQALANATLKIVLDIQGLGQGDDAESLKADMQALLEAHANLNNKVDANAGRPNPPTATSPVRQTGSNSAGYRGSGTVSRKTGSNTSAARSVPVSSGEDD